MPPETIPANIVSGALPSRKRKRTDDEDLLHFKRIRLINRRIRHSEAEIRGHDRGLMTQVEVIVASLVQDLVRVWERDMERDMESLRERLRNANNPDH